MCVNNFAKYLKFIYVLLCIVYIGRYMRSLSIFRNFEDNGDDKYFLFN